METEQTIPKWETKLEGCATLPELNQAELVVALQNEDVHKVYLYDETFSIPLNRSHITYDGRGNALINIMAQDNSEIVDFDNNEVYFYNLTVVFRFAESAAID